MGAMVAFDHCTNKPEAASGTRLGTSVFSTTVLRGGSIGECSTKHSTGVRSRITIRFFVKKCKAFSDGYWTAHGNLFRTFGSESA